MSASTTRFTLVLLLFCAGVGCAGSRTADELAVVAADAGPGSELWRRDLGRALEFTPVWLGDSWLAAVTDGNLWRLEHATGEKLWKEKLPSSPTGPPVVCGDIVVVSTDTPSGEVVGVRLEDGETKWVWKRAITYAAGGDSLLFLTARGGGVLRLNPATGDEIWKRSLEGAGWAPPTVIPGSRVIVVPVRRDSLVAMDIEKGHRVWSAALGPWPRTGFEGSSLLAATDDGNLFRLNLDTGRILARRTLPAPSAGVPVTGKGAVFVSLRDGTVLALEPGTLETRWERRLAPPLVSSVLLVDDRVYQSGPRGTVHVLDSETGEPQDSYTHPELLVVSPRAAGGAVAVSGVRGTLVVYRRGI